MSGSGLRILEVGATNNPVITSFYLEWFNPKPSGLGLGFYAGFQEGSVMGAPTMVHSVGSRL